MLVAGATTFAILKLPTSNAHSSGTHKYMTVQTKLMNRLGGWIIFNYEVDSLEEEHERLQSEFPNSTYQLTMHE
jgi:hypothetical protein